MSATSATGALAFLLRHSLRNRLRRMAAQVRNPRYAVALLAGMGYFALLITARREGNTPDDDPMRVFLPAITALLLGGSWLWGSGRNALTLRAGEAHFLLGGPIPRRAVVLYKLIALHAAVLGSALLLTGIIGIGLPWWARFPALAVLLSTLALHQTAASLVNTSATEHGGAGFRRSRIALAVFAVVAFVLVASVARGFRVEPGMEWTDALTRALDAPLPHALLLPLRWVLAPALATDVAAAFVSLPQALLIWALHVVWVIRAEEAHRDSAWRASLDPKEAGVRPALRLRAPRRSYSLASHGAPALALVWKNLILMRRNIRSAGRVFLIAMFSAVVSLLVFTLSPVERASAILSFMTLGFAAMMTLFGPTALRNDLRADLAKLSTLRTFPLSGRAVVGAEVAASGLSITVLQIGLVTLAVLFALPGRDAEALRISLIAFPAALLLMPGLNVLAAAVHNGLVLLFPRWSRIGLERPGGFEHAGQHLLTLVATMVLMVLGLVPSAIAGLVMYSVFAGVSFHLALVMACLGGIAVVWAEVVSLVMALGGVFERTDLDGVGATT